MKETLLSIAQFFDSVKYGYCGHEGYRKSTDLFKLIAVAEDLRAQGLVDAASTCFIDLGCADGRVNLLMSHFVKTSLGIEIDPEILSEYGPRKAALDESIRRQGLRPFPENIRLYHGSSLEESTYRQIRKDTGVAFRDIGLFYTYITLHDLFGEMISEKARPGALYMVYGFDKILPRYDGLELILPDAGSRGIVAVYRKP